MTQTKPNNARLTPHIIYIEYPVRVKARGFLKQRNGADVHEVRKELTYVTEQVHKVLTQHHLINADGKWVQEPQLWPILMQGITDGRT